MKLLQLNVFLADDDPDDCHFFEVALGELQFPTHLSIVHDGEQLMQSLLNKENTLPHVLFLDINMHRKNGLECLTEIKSNTTLNHLPVIILSTSFEQGVVQQFFKDGAQYFIRKPSEFSQFKKIIQQTLIRLRETVNISQPSWGNFIITVQPD
jgi:CheY-like chemotaxis protein